MVLQKHGRGVTRRWAATCLLVALIAPVGCGIAGFGGSLQLNVTDLQSRALTIRVRGGGDDARVVQIDANGERELGSGTVEIDRYVLKRATFGSTTAVGLFLCAKPCAEPLSSYLVAYSPDQLFTADGELQMQFRITAATGMAEDITRVITAEMLPDLWRDPTVETGPGAARRP